MGMSDFTVSANAVTNASQNDQVGGAPQTATTYANKGTAVSPQLTDECVSDFVALLASREPVPGGGGAAALAGALAAALGMMVVNLTSGKKKYEHVQAELDECAAQGALLQHVFEELIHKDAQAFTPLAQAYGIPRENPDREALLEQALIVAAEPPLEMMRAASSTIALLERIEKIGSSLVISDAGVGASLARAALESAALNVLVNTTLMRDRVKATELEREVALIMDEWHDRADQIYVRVKERVSS